MLFGLITPASILGLCVEACSRHLSTSGFGAEPLRRNTDSLKTQLYLINASMIMAGLSAPPRSRLAASPRRS